MAARRWRSSPRPTFARERWEQTKLLLGNNFRIARAAGLTRETPAFQNRR